MDNRREGVGSEVQIGGNEPRNSKGGMGWPLSMKKQIHSFSFNWRITSPQIGRRVVASEGKKNRPSQSLFVVAEPCGRGEGKKRRTMGPVRVRVGVTLWQPHKGGLPKQQGFWGPKGRRSHRRGPRGGRGQGGGGGTVGGPRGGAARPGALAGGPGHGPDDRIPTGEVDRPPKKNRMTTY